jgi:hypothetical protein
LLAVSPVCSASAGNVLPALAPHRRLPPNLSADSSAIAMPASPDTVCDGLQAFAGRRQGVAARRVQRPDAGVSADVCCPLTPCDRELAQALHRDLQELEFQELKQWKYRR